jgi:aspartate oxidase
MQSFQNYVQNSQTYLHHLSAQTSQLNQKQKEEQTIADKKDVWSEMREESQGIHYNTEFHQQEKRFNLMRKREEEEESMVLILRKPKELI